MKFIYLIFLTALLFGGCAPTGPKPFYWGNYSSTLYDFTKDPNEETLKSHKEEINKIFTYCQKMKKKVPPGVTAEYGFILLKEGNETEGLQYLDKEVELYPESETFITRIKSMYERGKNENS